VDGLIGPETVNTLLESTIAAFEDHSTLARTIDAGLAGRADTLQRLDDVGLLLEEEGIAGFPPRSKTSSSPSAGRRPNPEGPQAV